MSILTKVTQPLSKVVTKVKVNSPTVLVVTGSVCLVGTVIFAHRAGRKVEETVDANRQAINNIKDIMEAGSFTDEEGNEVEFTDADYRKELTHAYLGYAWDLTKLYGPVIIGTAATATCYISGHKILAGRLAGMTAAYEVIDSAFKKYRTNVVKISGEDADRKYLYGLDGTEKEKYYDTEVDEKTGEVKNVGKAKTRNIDVVEDVKLWNQASIYAVRFDKCKAFTKDMNYNIMHLDSLEKIANNKLESGRTSVFGPRYITMYEIYEMLGVTGELDEETLLMSHETGYVPGYNNQGIKFDIVMVPTKGCYKDGEFKSLTEIGLIDFNCPGSIRKQLKELGRI